ncbi:MAG: TlpA disulfide reductase family protein [Planctomycetaceae bacterium]
MKSPVYGPCLAFSVGICLSLWCGNILSQEKSAAPKNPAKSESVEDLFPIPDGTAKDLFAFIEKVQETPLPADRQTREASIAFFKAQIAAVLAACDAIDALKPDPESQVRALEERFNAYQNLAQVDESANQKLSGLVTSLKDDPRPAVKRLVAGYQLEARTPGFFRLDDKQQQQLIQDLLAYMDAYGIDSTSYAVATGLGDALEMSSTPQMGAPIFDRLAKELKKTGDPRAAAQIARYEGIARRLNLPGKFMELKGTTVDGEEFDWNAYRGKVVLVDFWASWCGPCRAEIPNMKAQLEKYGDKGFAIVGINLDQTKDAYAAYVEREEISWENLMSQDENERSWNHPLAVHYGVGGIPMAILVDRQGKVVSLSARGEELNQLLNNLLGDSRKLGAE